MEATQPTAVAVDVPVVNANEESEGEDRQKRSGGDRSISCEEAEENEEDEEEGGQDSQPEAITADDISDCSSDMLKRLRLRRSAENEEAVEERNEHGLVTRMRRSLKKNSAAARTPPPSKPMFATVCINNVNRSMEAHLVLQEAGLRVCSFGGGTQVSFPGRSADAPRVFGFGTTYETMYNTLREEDEARYIQYGVLRMLERNMAIKHKPQRFQALLNRQLAELDVIMCLDYSVFISVLKDLRMRIRLSFHKKRLHVICLDVEDTPQDAEGGGVLALELCQEINALEDASEEHVKNAVVGFEKRHHIDMFYVGLTV